MADADVAKAGLGKSEGSTSKVVDNRVSITVHLQPEQARQVDAAAERARMSRHDLTRDLLLARTMDDAPILACLAKLIAIYHRLDRAGLLDAELRAEIVAAVRELTTAARAEVAG